MSDNQLTRENNHFDLFVENWNVDLNILGVCWPTDAQQVGTI